MKSTPQLMPQSPYKVGYPRTIVACSGLVFFSYDPRLEATKWKRTQPGGRGKGAVCRGDVLRITSITMLFASGIIFPRLLAHIYRVHGMDTPML